MAAPGRPELEAEATARAIRLAQVSGAPLYIVHLSAQQALEAVTQARDDGRNVFAETCPQYLYLSSGRPGPAGLRGGEVRLLATGTAEGALGAPVARAAHQRT